MHELRLLLTIVFTPHDMNITYKKPKYKRDYSKECKDWADIESLGYGDKS